MLNTDQAKRLTELLIKLDNLLEWEKTPFDLETSERMVTFTFENDDNLNVLTEKFKDTLFDTRLERNGTLTVWFEL